MVFYYNETAQPDTDAHTGQLLTTAQITAQIDSAFQAWNSVGGSYLTLQLAGPTTECQVDNYTNVILWADLPSNWAGIVDRFPHGGPGISGRITGVDVILDCTDKKWTITGERSSPGSTDIRAVVTHELGHALGLGHSYKSANVMFGSLGTEQKDKWLLEIPCSATVA